MLNKAKKSMAHAYLRPRGYTELTQQVHCATLYDVSHAQLSCRHDGLTYTRHVHSQVTTVHVVYQ